MSLRSSTTIAAFFTSLVLSSMLHAQQKGAASLNDMLQHLETNLHQYDKRVPSFFCDEHLVSQVDSSLGRRKTITDSVFRLKRVIDADNATSLEESRDIKMVDGKPATSQGQDPNGPAMVDGLFEGGLAVVSASQKSCMKYKLERANGKQPSDVYIIRFSTELTPQNTNACLLQEASKGSATIDASSLQIKHLEIITPHHTIIPGDEDARSVIGMRTLEVDYAPVLLGGETLWMPSIVKMTAVGGGDTFHPTFWTFNATYRNYHKLEVTSHLHSGSMLPEQ